MKQLQQQVKLFCEENNLVSPIEHWVLDLVSEVGEVSKEVLKMTDYGRQPAQPRQEIKSELGDVLYSLIIVANTVDVDLEEALTEVLEKYKNRLVKGGAGSENE